MNKKRGKKYMYGKFHHDTYEFHRTLHELFDQFLQKHEQKSIEMASTPFFRHLCPSILGRTAAVAF